ncbi:hypothetical protein [Novosphingobium sp. MBES04]|uniref:hypothetical protein n=1 Tax=Novosphingobium sp. MBES04 TaxID=1206458 RepID=UPI00057E62C2|nr:hypothetical protein [Novosphingobium sp. MBES04]GAM06240.1 hypothetical protein MBENS4_3237 [Novosphingobium sp. MBES04]
MWIPLLCTAVTTPLIVLFFHLPQKGAYTCYFLIELFVSGYSAPLFAASPMLLPPRLRALGMATVLFVLNVVGQGMGPFLTGFISDRIGTGPAGGLGLSIALMQVFGVLGAGILLLAVPAFRKREG